MRNKEVEKGMRGKKMLGSKRKVMLQNKNDHKVYFPFRRYLKACKEENTHDVMHLALKNFIVGANAINNNFAPFVSMLGHVY